MAKAQEARKKLRVVALVRVGGELADVDTLAEDQRVRLANAIRCTLFNACHVGVAEAVPGQAEGNRGTDCHGRGAASQ